MKLSCQIVAALLLGACGPIVAQADARPRGGTHPANAAGHVGTHHPAGVAKPLRSAAPVAPTRNAIGAATQPLAIGTKGTGVGANAVVVKPNVVGVHAGTAALTPSVPTGAGRVGTTTNPVNAVRAAPSLPPAHAGGINGTGMARRSNAVGTIGGPARVASGITGTGMKQKR